MKYNLDYYKNETDNKPISEEYEEVLQKVNSVDSNFSDTLDKNSKIKNILALSEIRENILNWYKFKNDCDILEMNANYGEITGLLCEKAKNVISIETSEKYAQIIKKRYLNKNNLELIVGNIENIEINRKFDYIVIVGITEQLKEYLEYAKEHINEKGKILIAVNNKFGVKAWITIKDDAKVVGNDKTAISKMKLDTLLEGLEHKYYYPLPDYKLPNIIYTENNMPNMINIYRDLTYKDESVNFKEIDAFKEIINNNSEDFKNFANSFLIEASKQQLEDNKIKFITFSNIRKDEYRIKTVIEEKEVYKTNINNKSKKHIENVKKNIDILRELNINTLDSYDENKIISKYVNDENLENKLIRIFKENGKEEFFKEIKKYKEFLESKLQVTNEIDKNVFTEYKINCQNEDFEKLTFVKYGLWDLIFQNCFIINDEYCFYDQEWKEENVPVEYILYRAIIYFNGIKKYISDEDIFEKFNLKDYLEVFKKLDDKLQEKIRKPMIWKTHTEEEFIKNKNHKLKLEIQEKEQEITNLKNEIENLKKSNIDNNNQLKIIESSLSWKITKPLRIIRKMTYKSK